MKYIRTKDNSIKKVYADRGNIIECENGRNLICIDKKDIEKQADTIEELCVGFVIKVNTGYLLIDYYDKKLLTLDAQAHDAEVYGVIWTKGEHGEPILKSVAKMNKKGELELL